MESGLYCGDTIEVMRTLPDASVDLILCDLPYGTTAQAWDKCIDMGALWTEYARILAQRGTIALFCAQPFTSELVKHGKAGGVKWRYMWVWLKNTATGAGNAHNQPMRRYEEIAVFGRGAGKYNPQGLRKLDKPRINVPHAAGVYRKAAKTTVQEYEGYPGNVLYYDTVARSKRAHPNEKPVELLRYLVRTYTDAGDVVLDNTMGSGSTCVAAALEGRRYIGIERDARYYEIACARVQAAKEEYDEREGAAGVSMADPGDRTREGQTGEMQEGRGQGGDRGDH